MQDWLAMVQEAAKEGRRFARVRIVNPRLSDYNRWSLVIARHNVAAGEDIRYLIQDRAQEVGLPDFDYWLFDSRTLCRMHFDETDRFIGGELIDDSTEIVRHNYWRDAAWHHAVKRDEFATEEQLGRP
jgi:hypothetical protein